MNANMELYKTFYYVITFGSITSAAEKLCVSQPAVSQSMKQLESILGVKLFVRSPKGIMLTKEGETLAHYVKAGYESIVTGENNILKMKDLEAGEVRIGASDMTLQFYLLPYLEKFHDMYPKIKVNVTNGPTPETLRYLKEGKIDFGIVTSPFEYKNEFRVKRVKKVKDIFVAGKDFSELKGKVLPYSSLNDLPLICLEENTSTRKFIDKFLEEKNTMIEPEFELATSEMIVHFARRNLGIGCVVESFARQYITAGELFMLDFESKIPERYMCVVSDTRTPISCAGQKLLDIMENEIA